MLATVVAITRSPCTAMDIACHVPCGQRVSKFHSQSVRSALSPMQIAVPYDSLLCRIRKAGRSAGWNQVYGHNIPTPTALLGLGGLREIATTIPAYVHSRERISARNSFRVASSRNAPSIDDVIVS